MTTPVVFDRYTLLRKLAVGGMAEVHLARVQGPMGFEKLVVLKRMLPELAQDPSVTKMFLSEAKVAGTFSHPNVAQIFDFGQIDGTYYLAMEYVDGPTLRQVKRRAEQLGVKLPCDVLAEILARACEGLHYVHELRGVDGVPQGLVHRDISPDNIILSRNGNVKVLDFGIVTSTAVERQTRSGLVRGKLAYMPPEQLSAEPLDRRVDVWALGVVLYEMLALRRPYDATQDAAVMKAILFEPFTPIASVRADVPEALAAVVGRCLQKDRSGRFASARELQVALEAFAASVGPALGSYEIEGFVRELTEGNAPRAGSATLPATPALERTPHAARAPAAPPPDPPAPTRPTADLRPHAMPAAPARRARWPFVLAGLAIAGVAVAFATRSPPLVQTPVTRPPKEEPAPAPVAAPAPAPVAAPAPEPVPAPPRPTSKKRAAAPPRSVTVDVRVLPEGAAEIDGSPWTSGVLAPGTYTLRVVSKRFGDVSRPLVVPPCSGRVLVGYSFSSDRLTAACKDP